MIELLLRIKDLRLSLRIFSLKRKATRIAILDETGKEITMDQITVGKKRVLTARAVSDSGKPAKFQSGDVPVWTVSPDTSVQLFPAPDGLTCDALGATPGTATVSVKGKNVAGSDITGSVSLEVIEELASHIDIEVGPEVTP